MANICTMHVRDNLFFHSNKTRLAACDDVCICTTQDDEYMDPQIVCNGSSSVDTRPSTACKPCNTVCPLGRYVAGRCLRNNTPSSDTTYCVQCSPCARGEYLTTPCNGRGFADNKNCTRCAFGSNGTRAKQQCPPGSFLIDECVSGMDEVDRSRCTNCSSNCKAANYSRGEFGQYIATTCSPGDGRMENACGNCDGPCSPGQYIVSFCTGKTTSNRQCTDCRTSCGSRWVVFVF